MNRLPSSFILPPSSFRSAQRESNPHFRHGKAVGCRYIMGASNRWSNCQRTNRASDHGFAVVPGLEPTSPPTNLRSVPGVRSPRRRPTLRGGARTSAFHSVGSEGLEPSPIWLRARHAAASTLIPRLCAWTRRGGNRTLDLVLIRDLL